MAGGLIARRLAAAIGNPEAFRPGAMRVIFYVDDVDAMYAHEVARGWRHMIGGVE
jgi:hypothetical protein